MKKLILILFVALSFNIEAQYITNYAKNVKQTEIDGIYYYLPRNVIKLDFTVEEKQDIKGKFVNYTKELLNTDNYIKENQTIEKLAFKQIVNQLINQFKSDTKIKSSIVEFLTKNLSKYYEEVEVESQPLTDVPNLWVRFNNGFINNKTNLSN